MIKRENRLKKNKHFKFIYKHGESKQINKISMVFIKTKYQPFKVGFSVSKKVGKSVVRNKVKRRMTEAFKLVFNNIDHNYNYVFVAREGISEMSMLEIKENLELLLKRARLFNEND